jgi:lysozyme family protein
MTDEGLALMTFDWAVNSGGSKPAKCIQKFVSAKQDGVIGPKTLGLVAEKNPQEIIEYMYDSRQKYYESLRTFSTFGRGWTSRNKHTFELALGMSNE